MNLGIDVHKRYAQVAVMDEAGEIVEEVRVEREP
jgi:transposase